MPQRTTLQRTVPKDKKAPDHTGSIGLADAGEPAAIEIAPRDTLTGDDLAVEWRGGAP